MKKSCTLFGYYLQGELRAAVEVKSVLAATPLAQRHAFLKNFKNEIIENEEKLLHANRLDISSTSMTQVSPNITSDKSSIQDRTDGDKKEKEDYPRHGESAARMKPRPIAPMAHNKKKLRIDKLLYELDYLLSCPDPIDARWLEKLVPHTAEVESQFPADPQVVVKEVSVPLGFVGVLSRYRPRMMMEAISMGILAGNVVLIDGGAAVLHTNRMFMACARRALASAGLPTAAVVHVESVDASHRYTTEWLQVKDRVDVAIVCGPPKLYEFASQRSSIPLIRATSQITSLYVDRSASFETALRVIINSKYQREGAANSVTLLLVHAGFPRYAELMEALNQQGTILLGDEAAIEKAGDYVRELGSRDVHLNLPASQDKSLTIAVKTFDSLEQVLLFLDLFGSKQNDGIIATDPSAITEFCTKVDSAVVLVNASTRLSSGVPLGLGPDLAIATSKMNHRGPFTLNSWTTKKYLVVSKSLSGALRK